MIKLSGGEQIFAIDGQHRVEGIREALSHDGELADEEMTVIFVGHTMTDAGRERTRRLFTTLNKYAKPVSKAELIALNDDDTFAIVTRRLIDEYPGLSGAFVPLTPTANLAVGDRTSITSVIALYETVRTIAVPIGSREARVLETGPSALDKVAQVHGASVELWDALKARVPAIKKVCESKPEEERAGEFRTQQGGHVLMRPAGMQAFVKATRTMVDRDIPIAKAVATLAKVPAELADVPWLGVFWNGSSQTMILKNQKLALNLFLHMARQPLSPKQYPLTKEYQRALGDKKAKPPPPG